nr:copia protein [Tanacetum cinerariifolium]
MLDILQEHACRDEEEHDGRACIYGVLVSVDTNDILTEDNFLVLDIWKEFILVNDTREVQSWVVSRLGRIVLLEEKKQVVQKFKDRVYGNKLDENGIVSRNKARLAAQGYNQQESIDYDETYAPVA